MDIEAYVQGVTLCEDNLAKFGNTLFKKRAYEGKIHYCGLSAMTKGSDRLCEYHGREVCVPDGKGKSMVVYECMHERS